MALPWQWFLPWNIMALDSTSAVEDGAQYSKMESHAR
jgi:hypothetical protein